MTQILSIDGGGIRGYIPSLVLAEIERRTGCRTVDLFDLLAGTSTGGILALWSSGASAIWLRHVRNNRRLFVLDDSGALAPINAKAAVDTNDVVTLGQLNTAAIGLNQTWQDVLPSRSAGVNYQNTTGRPIQVSLSRYSNGSWEVFCGASAGSMVSLARFLTVDSARPIIAGYSFIVPNGWFYRLDVGGSDDVSSRRWAELR